MWDGVLSHATRGSNPLLLTNDLVPEPSSPEGGAGDGAGTLLVIPRDLEEETLLCAPWDDEQGRAPRKCLSGNQCVGWDARISKKKGCDGFCLMELMSRAEIESLKTHGIYPPTRRMCVLCTRRMVTDAYTASLKGSARISRNAVLNNYCNVVSTGPAANPEAYPRFMCIPLPGNLQVESSHLIHSSSHVASKFPKAAMKAETDLSPSAEQERPLKRKRVTSKDEGKDEPLSFVSKHSNVWHGIVGQIRCFSFHDLSIEENLKITQHTPKDDSEMHNPLQLF